MTLPPSPLDRQSLQRRAQSVIVWLVLMLGIIGETVAAAELGSTGEEFFEQRIRPLLVEKCFRCHGGDKVSDGLRVDSRETLVTGGDNGPAIVPGDPMASLLMKAVRYQDDDLKMPPDKRLSDAEIASLEQWIQRGAAWPAKTAAFRPARHWSYEPVRVSPPPVDASGWSATTIDQYLAAKQREHGLMPSPPADKRTLLRRATFDLLGLPPSPEDVDAFVADEAPDAFARSVDRLLASPHHGERWGRHWLDIARYADSAGETADFPVPQAWRYRNYVIDAFNRDKPYDEFLREQLAGDILAQKPGHSPDRYSELLTATGYLAVARRFGFDVDKDHFLTIEDTIDTLGKSILGLTIACARCHDHKYEPITAADYYALYGIFDSTRYPFPGCEKVKAPRDLVPLLPPDEIARVVKPHQDQLARLDAEIKRLGDEQAAIAQQLKEAAAKHGRVLARGEFDDGREQPIAAGPGGALEPVAVQRGQMIQLSILPRGNFGADSTLVEFEIREVGGDERTWNVARDVVDEFLAGNPHADRFGHAATWCFLDARHGPLLLPESLKDFEKHAGLNFWRRGDWPAAFVTATDQPLKAWSTLPPRSFFLHPAADGAVALGWLSPIDGTVRITGRIADAHPGGPDGVAWSLELFAADMATGIVGQQSAARRLQQLGAERTTLAARQPQFELVYAVSEGSPHNVKMHMRGDPESLGAEVPRRMLQLFGGEPVSTSGSGRLELAQWISSPDHPLTARVLVNRLWQHHFGAGLVRTPNDFGSRGEPPSHPELLDWLADRFVRGGWSLKSLHREMLLSKVFGQGSFGSPSDPSTADASNLFLSRFSRRRLSAEEIRDSILAVMGELDCTPGQAHPFPEQAKWGFTQHAPFTALYETNRRSVYLMTQRIKRNPFLALFDGADTNTSTPQRFTTIVPTQALFFLNDPFVHDQSMRLASRLASAADDDVRLLELYRRLFARPPTTDERETAARFRAGYFADLQLPPEQRPAAAWSALARVLMSTNEFLFVD